ncbi:hypothetical protein AKG09_11485, partial [Neisseria sp. 83E34]
VNAVRQSVVAVAKADVVMVAVELGDELVNAVAFVDFGEPQTGTAMSKFKLLKNRRPSERF